MLAGLQGKIKRYLLQVSFVKDSAALKLLKETIELLEAQKHIDNNRAKSPNLDDTFKDIQLFLARIALKKSSTPTFKDYAAAAAVAQSYLKTLEAPSWQKDPKSKQIKALTSKKLR